MITSIKNKSRLARPAPLSEDPGIAELQQLAGEVGGHIRQGCFGALRIGIRLMHLHNTTKDSDAPGGFRAALTALDGCDIPKSTAYRWINAASAALMRLQEINDPALIELPKPGTGAWKNLEHELERETSGMSLRRLLIGSAAPSSDEARLDTLITASESGDPHADAFLEKISKGEMTLVQAIRAQAGAVATKDKARKDPVYLDIDGTNGQPVGLVPKCLITLARAFDLWPQLDETARKSVKQSWKALIANLPADLR